MRLLETTFLAPITAIFIHYVACAGDEVLSEWNTNGTYQPRASNFVSFPGFNFTNLTTTSTITFSPSSEVWRLQMNYSIEPANQTGNGAPVPLYSYALQLPEHQLPSSNQSTWRLCTSVAQFPFLSNITDLGSAEDATGGDCTPYLGGDCVRDYAQAMTSPRRFLFCPYIPYFEQIPSCLARIGLQTSDAVSGITFGSEITNWVSWDVAYDYSSGRYTNTTTGQVLTNADVHGLRSGQLFWKSSLDSGALSNSTLQREQASVLQFITLSQSPSDGWFANETAGSGSQALADVRLICARVNATFNTNNSSAQHPVSNGATGTSPPMLPVKLVVVVVVLMFANIA